jgi:hypothetical protein
MIYEKNERGEYTGWDQVNCFVDSDKYDDYLYFYACRLQDLHEQMLEKTCPNYWRRRRLLDKFDNWKEGWHDFPWHWEFEEVKEKRHGRIRTPKQFIDTLSAASKFVADEFKKDPDYQPPDHVLRFMFQAKKFLDQIRPTIEEHLKARGYNLAELERDNDLLASLPKDRLPPAG